MVVRAWAEGAEVSGKDWNEVERYVRGFKRADRKRKSRMKMETAWKKIRGFCAVQ